MQDLNSVLIQGVVETITPPPDGRPGIARLKLKLAMVDGFRFIPVVVPNPTLASYTVKEVSAGMRVRIVGHLDFDPRREEYAVFAQHIELAPKATVVPMAVQS